MVHKLFHMKLHLWPTHYHIHIIHVNSIPMNNMHFKYTLGHMKYTIQGIQNLCYLDAEVNGKFSIFFSFLSLFHLVFSLVCQGSHLRWWYSTQHIFHHLLITLVYSHSLPISTENIYRFFFFQLSISKAQVFT